MFRVLVGSACLLSLLLCAAAVALTAHSHRAGCSVVWRTDAFAAAEGAHTSFRSVLRHHRECRIAPGQRVRRLTLRSGLSPPVAPPAPAWNVTREYVSLAVANGSVEYRRFGETIAPFL